MVLSIFDFSEIVTNDKDIQDRLVILHDLVGSNIANGEYYDSFYHGKSVIRDLTFCNCN